MSRSSVSSSDLTVGQVAFRSSVAVSALHFYEAEGLIRSTRTAANQRRYPPREYCGESRSSGPPRRLGSLCVASKRPSTACPTSARRPGGTGRGLGRVALRPTWTSGSLLYSTCGTASPAAIGAQCPPVRGCRSLSTLGRAPEPGTRAAATFEP